jgi:hypothetical protein
MAIFMGRIQPVVNETIRALAKTKFIEDPNCRPAAFQEYKHHQLSLQSFDFGQ